MNPWKILGVHRQMSLEEIHAQYLKLARIYHPDTNKDEKQHFGVITGAYALLKNKDELKKFVAQLAIIGKECQGCRGKGAIFRQKGVTGRTAITCSACEGSGILLKKEKKK